MTLLLCVSLLGTCLLTGCGKTDGTEAVESESEGTEKKTDGSNQSVILSIEDYDITMTDYYLYLIQYCFNNKSAAASVDENMTKTIQDATLKQLELETVEYLLAQKTEGLEVADSDMEKAQTMADSFYSHFGEEFFKNYGIEKQDVINLFERQTYINALCNKSISDLTADYKTQYADQYGDLKFHSVYYALFPSIQYDADGNAVQDADGKNVALTEDEMTSQKALAQEFQAKAAAGEKTMEELVDEYNIAYCSGIERNYDGAYEQSLNDVVSAMAEGDISDVITTEAGYMIVRMDKLDDQEYKAYAIDYMAAQNAEKLLPTMQENWVSQSGISQLTPKAGTVETVDIKGLCEEMESKSLY